MGYKVLVCSLTIQSFWSAISLRAPSVGQLPAFGFALFVQSRHSSHFSVLFLYLYLQSIQCVRFALLFLYLYHTQQLSLPNFMHLVPNQIWQLTMTQICYKYKTNSFSVVLGALPHKSITRKNAPSSSRFNQIFCRARNRASRQETGS